MKTKTKKAIALALCAVMLIAGTALTTVAYLTSQDTAVNTFTVGDIEIILDETDVDLYGVKDGDTRIKANEYKLVPGLTYLKDPQVHVVAESEDCYVRILMTLNKQSELNAIFEDEDGIDLREVFNFNESEWKYVRDTKNADNTRTYEFRYKEIVEYSDKDQDLEKLFTEFKCPAQIKEDELETLKDFEIKLVAQAVQARGFVATETQSEEDLAWGAFDTQNK